ncbi:MAG: peptidoglycan DD-metalloendopeptidase family protein [Methylovulum sp.]|nr:peptidoglycan DD-metalloendopeptidase family protein [Methylovulum sp.]
MPLQAKTAASKPETTARQQTKSTYEVKAGETLYSIGVKNGLPYETLARWNQLPPSYKILAGQKLKLFDPQQQSNSSDNKAPSNQMVKNKPQNADKAVTGAKSLPENIPVSVEKSGVQKKQPIEKQKDRLYRLDISSPIKDNALVADKKGVEKPALLQADAEPKKAQSVAKKTEDTSAKKTPFQVKSKTEPANKNPKKQPDVVTKQKKADKTQKKAISSVDNKKLLKLNFAWPIKGSVAKIFAKAHNKGIDIAGTEKKQPVSAAEAGTVVYQGEGLVGFKNLIIIKHNNEYLSAYANNSRMLVKEGQQVKQGQMIAEIGQTSAKQKPLHFEIRKNGNPVDPLHFLPK